ncbi:MAG: RNA-binding domain-containing protein [Anaerostipes sp.]
MTVEKLEELLQEEEGFTVEYKECVNGLNNSVFETVCSFSNRYGGHILLGVKEVDHKGIVIGVNPNCIVDIKKNFVNMLNNPQKINPSLYLSLEEMEYKGMKVLWVYVPVTSQLQMCSGKIFDRNEDADQDVTSSVDLVSNISNRKSSSYTERTVFPYATEDDLCMDLVKKTRQMAVNKNSDHPWKDMTDMELLKSAGLYERDRKTGKEGYNMACILLFGTREAILSCVPGYKTDAIYRAQRVGRIEVKDFTPYPKNPILANFFVNIGYADSLGSGVRNLYKYTKIYSGGEPDFEEGDVFKLTVPLCNDTDESKNESNESKNESNKVDSFSNALMKYLMENPKVTQRGLAKTFGVSRSTIQRYLEKLEKSGRLVRVGSNRSGYWKTIL